MDLFLCMAEQGLTNERWDYKYMSFSLKGILWSHIFYFWCVTGMVDSKYNSQ